MTEEKGVDYTYREALAFLPFATEEPVSRQKISKIKNECGLVLRMVRRNRKGGRLALFAVTVGMECTRAGGSASALSINGTCNVCRGVTQGFVDLHAEWPLVQKMEKAVTTFPHDGGAGIDGYALHRRDDSVSITYEAAIERFCDQSFLSSNQQRVCYSIAPFAAEVGKWLGLGVPPDRICRKLGKRNPETCFDAREAERPSDTAEPLLDWRSRPPSIPDGVDCSIEHRNSLSPRWVLFD